MSREDMGVLREEMQRIHARPPLISFGIWMLGPALLKFGSPEQKATHLPRIARGEIRWCQGYSEPDAGSDLASLRTKAEDRGDHFLVNGQKIWTSYADKADWIFCLVGTLHRGWDVAKYLLTHEREMIAGGGNLYDLHALNRAAAAQAEGGKLADPILRGEIARAAIDTYASEATRQRYLAEAANGGEIGARSALLKYDGTELNKRRHELLMALAGAEGLYFDGNLGPAQDVARGWLRSKGNSIEGRTSEIMLDIVAKRLLELPAD